jgi:adenylosuccinate lyase
MSDIGSKRFKHRFLARTHGQPAIVSNSFHEDVFNLFSYRLKNQYLKLEKINQEVKFGGAIGNLDAHYTVSSKNWGSLIDCFIKDFGLKRQQRTTQIENYEHLVEYLDTVKRINNILIDFCRDFWYYISIGYIKIQKDEESVGSSTMPQKINPILFENAEGNLEYANSQISFFSDKR